MTWLVNEQEFCVIFPVMYTIASRLRPFQLEERRISVSQADEPAIVYHAILATVEYWFIRLLFHQLSIHEE